MATEKPAAMIDILGDAECAKFSLKTAQGSNVSLYSEERRRKGVG